MTRFRDFLSNLQSSGELITVEKEVDPRYELGALLQQAEARSKAIQFNSVKERVFPCVGGLFTTSHRMAQSLGLNNPQGFTLEQHWKLICDAIEKPIKSVIVDEALCQESIAIGDQVNCDQLPAPTFFDGDSGPFLTAATVISRNPSNGILNAGIYRILMLDANHVAVSASPTSALFGFMETAAKQGQTTSALLVIGSDPSVLMTGCAKVPSDVSELDVAGALNGEPLRLVKAVSSDLLAPADSEIVLEVEIDPSDEKIPNTMGEFGDFYGTQLAAVAKVTAITNRKDAIFHTVMAGAGLEHNGIGFIILSEIEPEISQLIKEKYPAVQDVHAYFEPPRFSVVGDIYIKLHENPDCNVTQLIKDTFALRSSNFDIARIVRRVIVVDHDIDIQNYREIDWALSVRVNRSNQIQLITDLAASDGNLRVGIDATESIDDKEKFRRPEIPGAAEFSLDDYLN
ncbi:MAG: UbiD family decarboxylase [Pseudomonadota bacterium]|nr:UbiD family decarboxylase [Pseudomonadota bacterium]